MEHQNEYHDSMVSMLELVWGEGFMAPGGEGNVAKMVEGLELEGRRVLDLGCGVGGPACILAGKYGAHVVGTDLEPPLIERARQRAEGLGLSDRTEFEVVTPGLLTFEDESFDLVVSSGGVTQTADKLGIFRECLRVLKPGGTFSAYDWMRCEGEYSEDMRYWFETEGLTYAMETPRGQEAILREAGFDAVDVVDGSDWYRARVRTEYERLRTRDFPRLVELIGKQAADHAVENWRATVVVCEKGEMLQVYSRAQRSDRGELP
ncbi:MAG: methyltransferase domain-containing protein [Deltaproteobacteria bacterium]|nr:methyltransferase domain-containing protein [Deltaproteobacteria bacterium]